MNYDLPTALDVGGVRHEIRSDYRAVLDIISALSDFELTNAEKVNVLLRIFYIEMPDDVENAINQCFRFINCGQPESKSAQKLKLMDWEQDFPLVASAINIVSGREIRTAEYMHWWTFVGYYMNIGDSMFFQVVAVRKKMKTGAKLDKAEKEFYRNNKEIIDLQSKYMPEEDELINEWT